MGNIRLTNKIIALGLKIEALQAEAAAKLEGDEAREFDEGLNDAKNGLNDALRIVAN